MDELEAGGRRPVAGDRETAGEGLSESQLDSLGVLTRF
jgi:hypothetical protein